MSPVVEVVKRAMAERVVDLAAPLRPKRQNISP